LQASTGYHGGDYKYLLSSANGGKRGADVRPDWQKRYAPLSAFA
jgi:hypothetical protein